MHKVFVYGTLKKDHGNHGYLAGSKLIKQAYVPGFTLINAESFPYAIQSRPSDFAIGEVYEVDDETFRALDGLEGYPSHYQRRPVNTYKLDSLISRKDEQVDVAWIYYIKTDKYNMLKRFGTTHEWGMKPIPYAYRFFSNKPYRLTDERGV